jgi:hypothetical protein
MRRVLVSLTGSRERPEAEWGSPMGYGGHAGFYSYLEGSRAPGFQRHLELR